VKSLNPSSKEEYFVTWAFFFLKSETLIPRTSQGQSFFFLDEVWLDVIVNLVQEKYAFIGKEMQCTGIVASYEVYDYDYD